MARPSRVARLLLSVGDAGVHHFTYVSTGNQKRFEQFLPHRKGRGCVINNGVELQRFESVDLSDEKFVEERFRLRSEFGFPPTARVAVFVGVYSARRPLLPILQSLEMFLNESQTQSIAQQWYLLIIGDGDPAERQKIIEHDLQNRVHFAGRRSDIATFLPFCDLMVSASHYEGLSIAMLEAWSCGLPVLSYAVDGIEDVLGHEEAGRQLVPHEGGVKDYSRQWFLFMQELAGKRAANFVSAQRRCWMKRRHFFSTNTMLEGYTNLYRIGLKKTLDGEHCSQPEVQNHE